MSKAQRGILLGYCVVIFFTCIILVPWKIENVFMSTGHPNDITNRGVGYAPIWVKEKIIDNWHQGEDQFYCSSTTKRTSNIALDHIVIELIAATLIAGAAYLAVDKKK